MATLNLTAPVNGEQNVFVISEDVTSLDLAFDSSEALFERVDGNLVISFENGSSIRLENFYDTYSADFMPEFVLDGFSIAGEDFFAAFDANLMPAAGSAVDPNAMSNQGSELASLTSSTDNNPNNSSENSAPIDGNAGSAASFISTGMGSGLTYLAMQENVLGGDNSGSLPPVAGGGDGGTTPPTTGGGNEGDGGTTPTTPTTPPTTGGGNEGDGGTTPTTPTTPGEGGDGNGGTTTPGEGGEGSDGSTPPPAPVTPKDYNLSVSEAHGSSEYAVTATEGEATATEVIKLGDKYADDITVSESGEVTITGELADYINSLTIDQNLTIEVEDANGNTFTINASGSNANDDNLVIDSFWGSSFNAQNQDKDHINTAATDDLDIDTAYKGSESTLDLGEGNDTLVVKSHLGGNIAGGNGEDNITVNGTMFSGTVDGGAGNDNIHIESVSGGTSIIPTITGGEGEDTITVDSMLGGKIDGGTGSDSITIESMTGGTIYGGNESDYAKGDVITVNGNMSGGAIDSGAGQDTINLNSVDQSIIKSGTGNDVINIETLEGASVDFANRYSGETFVYGGNGQDTINIGTMNGGMVTGDAGSDIVNIENLNGGIILGGGAMSETDQTFVKNMTGGTINTEYAEVENMSGGIIRQWENVNNDQAHKDNNYVDIKVGTMTGGQIIADSEFMSEAYRATAEDTIEIGTLTGGHVDAGYANDTVNITTMGNPAGDSTPATVDLGEGDDVFNLTYSMFQGTVNGGEGNDTFNIYSMHGYGNSASTNSYLNGGEGDDTFNVSSMNAGVLDGGAGDDTYNLIRQGGGELLAGDGNDTINIGQQSNGLTSGGEGDDVITIQVINGTRGQIQADEGNDTVIINELTGDNSWSMGGVIINGGEGHDVLRIDSAGIKGAVTFDNEISFDDDGNLVIEGVTAYNIDGFEAFDAGLGNDTITGNDFDNILFGGEGSDLLTGGLGNDTFGFNLDDFTEGANDTITDFGNGEDFLDLTAFKTAGYDIDFSANNGEGLITITDLDGAQQTITLQDISDSVASQIESQIESGDFDGGIGIK